MRLDFDINEFCQNLRATKPPYECPVKDCGKIYKSFAGIQNHVFSCHQDNSAADSEDDSQISSTSCTDSQKIVEIEIDGKVQKLNIYEQLTFISKSEWEALVPVKSEVVPPEAAKTPTPKPIIARYAHKKTPRLTALPENPAVISLARGSPEKAPAAQSGPPRLPEPQFTVLADWDNLIPDALERPASYYRFIEKSNDELDEEVEYDLDEEDLAWLKVMNQRRKAEGYPPVAPESLELLLDRLEKESYFQMQSAGKEQSIPIDEDAVCCICMDGECQNSNVILFCDMCNLAVHQECYGVPYIPEGQWLCRRCLQSPSRAVECALCPNRGGAFKQTDDGRWAHVVCALWIPEVCFSNTVFLEPIDSIPNIPAARWKLTCYVCKQRGVGACIQCHKANCYTAFHVTCAQAAGLHMKIDTVRDATASGVPVSIRKTAFCDAHAPADSDVVRDANDSGRKGQTNPGQVRAVFRERMKQARKMLAEKRQAPPVVSVPTIPPDKVREIGALLHLPGKSKFVQRLIAYWTLKRQARNGVPLLRRLHNTHPQRHQEEKTGEEEIYDQVRFWQRLRQDLERARLLCELIRKRERTKRLLLKCKEEELELKLWPEQFFFRKLLDVLREKDVEMGEVFAEPVDVKEVPDYLDIVKNPMDLATMRQKLEQKHYCRLEALYRDFSLMIDNCLEYNSRETIFYKTALKMRDVAKGLFRQTKVDMEDAGLQAYIGTVLDVVAQPMSQAQQDDIAKQVDAYLCDSKRAQAPLESQLSHLEDLLAKAQSMPQNQAKSKRVRALRLALGQVKRQLSLEAGGRAAATRASASPQKKLVRAAPVPIIVKNPPISSDSEQDSESDSSVSSAEASKPDPPARAAPAATTRRGRNQPVNGAGPRQLTMDAFLARKDKERQSKLQEKKDAELKGKVINKVMKRSGKDSASSASTTAASVSSNSTAVEAVESLNESRITALPVTPVKQTTEGTNTLSAQPSPAGVNRRTAVLFTRKAAAALKKPEAPAPPTKRGSTRTRKPSETTASNAPAIVPANTASPAPNAPITAPSTTASRRKGGTKAQQQSTQQQTAPPSSLASGLTSQSCSGLFSMSLATTSTSSSIIQPSTLLSSNNTDLAALPLESESFRIYRPSRPGGGDDDDFKRSRSTSPSHTSDSDSESQDSDEDGGEDEEEDVEEEEATGNATETSSLGAATVGQLTQPTNSKANGFDPTDLALQPMDLVWAKCRGFPWYPALIINPGMPRTGVLHNGVPIPVPPEDVLALGQQGSNQKLENHFLVLFFDAKRTWQWLPRSKLEPLGVDAGRDKCHLVGSRRPADRRAVKAAYQEALLHRCQVAGQEVQLSGEDSSSDSASLNSDSDHDAD